MTVIKGVVREGKKKATSLGFPTANMSLNSDIDPGVYAGEVEVEGVIYKTAIFIPKGSKVLEAHIIGFTGTLYGVEITVFLNSKIRDLIIYDGESKMSERIAEDVKKVKSIYGI
ncbi:MAG: hypothetical protein COV70_03790 [Parcubacteria group bacterium CG11_big_fil_rev_8_21_14_0_20_39_22]|nr:MAG: hypothetical protein COV70_03790 [Parcubacteria group bacterium CG11_big_fil_rev_8_21_14_0_20_39_22]